MSGSMAWRWAPPRARWRPLSRRLAPRAQRLSVRLDLTFCQIGVLVPLVLFLLGFFSASNEPGTRRSVDLPGASNVVELVPAPVVSMNRRLIFFDEHLVGSSQAIEEVGQVVPRLDELYNALETRRSEEAHASRGLVLLEVDQEVPAVVLLSVIRTAALAGYPHLGLLVLRREPSR